MRISESVFGFFGVLLRRVSVFRRRGFGVVGVLLFLVGVVVPSVPSGAQSSLVVHSRSLGSVVNGWQTTTWGNSSAALLVDATNWGGFQVKRTGVVTFPQLRLKAKSVNAGTQIVVRTYSGVTLRGAVTVTVPVTGWDTAFTVVLPAGSFDQIQFQATSQYLAGGAWFALRDVDLVNGATVQSVWTRAGGYLNTWADNGWGGSRAALFADLTNWSGIEVAKTPAGSAASVSLNVKSLALGAQAVTLLKSRTFLAGVQVGADVDTVIPATGWVTPLTIPLNSGVFDKVQFMTNVQATGGAWLGLSDLVLNTTAPATTTTVAPTTTTIPGTLGLLKVRGVAKYVNGTNSPWLKGWYGFDLAPNALLPGFFSSFPTAESLQMFANASTLKLNVIRQWVLEGGQGILWDAQGYASGISPTLLSSLSTMFSQANTKNQAIELVLFTHSDINAIVVTGGKKNFATDALARQKMLDNVVTPIVNLVKNDPALFGFDVVNEVNVVDYPAWQTFIPAAVAKIKLLAPGSQTTVSYAWYGCCAGFAPYQQTELQWIQSNTAIDFFDVHLYEPDANAALAVKPAWLTKPVLIGEFGQQYFDASGNLIPGAATETSQGTFASVILPKIKLAGYAGALSWGYFGTTPSAQVDPSDQPRRLVRPDGSFTPTAAALQNFGAQLP
jgi:hypothetical protein